MYRKTDIGVGIGILAGAAILFHETLKIQAPRFEPMGSAMLPRIVLGIMALLALNLIREALRKKKQDRAPETDGEDTAFRVQVALATLITLGATCLYTAALSLELLHYYPATFLFITALTAFLSRGNKKYTLIAACVAVSVIALLHILAVSLNLVLPGM